MPPAAAGVVDQHVDENGQPMDRPVFTDEHVDENEQPMDRPVFTDEHVDENEQPMDRPVFTDEHVRFEQQKYAHGDTTTPLCLDFRKTLDADIAVIKTCIKADFEAGKYKSQRTKFYGRLQSFVDFICTCDDVTLILQIPRNVASILPISKILVHDPLSFNTKVRALLASSALWQRQALTPTNPTWLVYEFLRKIGMKPRFRGPSAGCPGRNDMVYYYRWTFHDDAAFEGLSAPCKKRKKR